MVHRILRTFMSSSAPEARMRWLTEDGVINIRFSGNRSSQVPATKPIHLFKSALIGELNVCKLPDSVAGNI